MKLVVSVLWQRIRSIDIETDPVAVLHLLLAEFRLDVDGATASTRLPQFQNR